MRIAIFSDVHGNRLALEAVLRDIEAHTPDAIANLGDQLWGAADPGGAWALQQSLGAVTVRGNTDEFLLQAPEALAEGPRAWASWLTTQLPESTAATLAALPLVQSLAEGEVVIAHGSLDDPWQALLFDLSGPAPRPREEQELLAAAQRYPQARVFVVGHTHRELLRSVGGLTFINVGPVSRYLDGYPVARWLLLEQQRGHWCVQFRRVSYDVAAAIDWAKAHSPFGDEEAALLAPAVRR